MEELKRHFIGIAEQVSGSKDAEKLAESLRRQIFEAMKGGLLTVDDVTEIDEHLPEGALYFSGSLLHDAP